MTNTLHIAETDSTNAHLKRLLNERILPHGFCLSCDYQTAGRGEGSNQWESAAGQNVLMSVLLRPTPFSIDNAFLLSELTATALCDALQTWAPNLQLKWPNDLYVGDRKLGGVLIETMVKGRALTQAIVGIGVNVNQMQFVSDAPNPVSLRQLIGYDTDCARVCQSITNTIVAAFNTYTPADSTALQQRYRSRLYRRSGMHTFAAAGGRFKATIADVYLDGTLILCTESGEQRAYRFKEVQFIIQ